MNFDEIAELNISNFPELPNLQILYVTNSIYLLSIINIYI